MTTTRAFMTFLGISAAAFAAGCDQPEEGGPPRTGGVAIVTPIAPPSTPRTYEAICRHYCETLEQTLIYWCLANDGGPSGVDDCTSRFDGTAARCTRDRCVSNRVEPSLCLVQCDGLAMHYSAYCGRDDHAPPPLCVTPPAEQHEACRAGCAIDVP